MPDYVDERINSLQREINDKIILKQPWYNNSNEVLTTQMKRETISPELKRKFQLVRATIGDMSKIESAKELDKSHVTSFKQFDHSKMKRQPTADLSSQREHLNLADTMNVLQSRRQTVEDN